MRRLLATGVLTVSTLLVLPQAHGAEGRVSHAVPATVDAARVAQYSRRARAKDSTVLRAQQTEKATRHSAAASSASVSQKILRDAPVMSLRSADFYFHDADSVLITDRDEDGYFSELRVRFDADSNIGDELVYARLYLRRLGEEDWFLYHETEDFWLEGHEDDDDYYVTTTLEDGFATGQYDVLIDLYESGYSGIVATIGPHEMPGLEYLPLEEVGLDVPIELPGYAIGEVTTTLLIDEDGDGHYSQFDIEFDPDADFDGSYVYARVWVRPQGGDWIEEHVTEDFLVDARGDADTYGFTADWISGYPTAYYDVQIDLFDSASGLLVASAGSERPELAQIPLEDQSRDVRPNPPSNGGGGGGAISHERGGGGAFGLLWLIGLLTVGCAARVMKNIARRVE
jgi:hypothetical protein